jgi:hypothetical protein
MNEWFQLCGGENRVKGWVGTEPVYVGSVPPTRTVWETVPTFK